MHGATVKKKKKPVITVMVIQNVCNFLVNTSKISVSRSIALGVSITEEMKGHLKFWTPLLPLTFRHRASCI